MYLKIISSDFQTTLDMWFTIDVCGLYQLLRGLPYQSGKTKLIKNLGEKLFYWDISFYYNNVDNVTGQFVQFFGTTTRT